MCLKGWDLTKSPYLSLKPFNAQIIRKTTEEHSAKYLTQSPQNLQRMKNKDSVKEPHSQEQEDDQTGFKMLGRRAGAGEDRRFL